MGSLAPEVRRFLIHVGVWSRVLVKLVQEGLGFWKWGIREGRQGCTVHHRIIALVAFSKTTVYALIQPGDVIFVNLALSTPQFELTSPPLTLNRFLSIYGAHRRLLSDIPGLPASVKPQTDLQLQAQALGACGHVL